MTELASDQKRLTIEERRAFGKSLRKHLARSSHGEWQPSADRPDPIALLQEQDRGRLENLLPIKYGRMLESSFAFLRGSAVVMASDLAASPVTGIKVVLCGDAHLSNFGIFATPERNLVFDINDFDEAYPGPWEWDLKRLAASAVVAGRANGFSEKTCRKLARITARTYREAMQRFAQTAILDVWYYHVDVDSVLAVFDKYATSSKKIVKKTVTKARTRTTARTFHKLTETVNGKRQFINTPPLVVRLSDLLTQEQKQRVTEQDVENAWSEYIQSLPKERHRLLARFRVTDTALRVGGVGSVGTRCAIALLEGDAEHDSIILQQKEAGTSALEPYLDQQEFSSQAQRIVFGQRLMQAASDIFLGWNRGAFTDREYYWRQLKDQKGSFSMQALDEKGMGSYLGVCGVCLARAHARSGDAAAISGYLGNGEVFDKAVSRFAMAYADQTERDYQALVSAIDRGQIIAQTGI